MDFLRHFFVLRNDAEFARHRPFHIKMTSETVYLFFDANTTCSVQFMPRAITHLSEIVSFFFFQIQALSLKAVVFIYPPEPKKY